MEARDSGIYVKVKKQIIVLTKFCNSFCGKKFKPLENISNTFLLMRQKWEFCQYDSRHTKDEILHCKYVFSVWFILPSLTYANLTAKQIKPMTFVAPLTIYQKVNLTKN